MGVKKGFTLIELSLVVVLGTILSGALVPNYIRSLHIEASRKTALEMSQLAEAVRVFYIRHNSWPQDLQTLKTGGFLDSEWEGKNPFGGLYAIELNGMNIDVTTSLMQTMAPVVSGLLPMATSEADNVIMTVTPPGAALSSVPTGVIMSWPSSTVPDGWLLCDGRPVSRTDQAGLFAVLGITYGAGNGSTTFNLPDLRGRTVVGLDNMGGSEAHVIKRPWARSLGGVFGEEEHQLTIAEMPAHTHDTRGTYVHYVTVGPNGSMENTGAFTMTTQSAGGNAAHNTVQPSMALYWIIRA